MVDTITGDLPVPTNIIEVPQMDDFIASMLSTKGKNFVVDKDKDFIRIQNKIRDVMGPLTAAWKDIELFRTGETDESIQADVIGDQLQKSIIVLGQASCAVTYQRRLSSLVNFTDIKTARSLLRDNTESLGKVSKDLFGKDFKAHLKAETKASKDAEDYFSQHSSKKTTLKPSSKPLFRSGPFPNQRGKGQSPFKKSSRRREKTYQQRFSGEYTKKPLFQHVNTTRLVANTEPCPSFNKTHVSDKCSRYAFCGKNKTFSSKLAKTVKRPSHTKHCQRLGDSTVRGTSSTKRTS